MLSVLEQAAQLTHAVVMPPTRVMDTPVSSQVENDSLHTSHTFLNHT